MHNCIPRYQCHEYLLFQTITPRSCAHWCAFIATQHLMDETVQISIIYPGRQLILLRWRHLEFRMKLRTGLQSSGLEHLGTFQDRRCLVFKKPFPCPGYCISVRSMEDSAVAFQRMSFQSTAHKLTCILAVDQRLHLYGSESMCHANTQHAQPPNSFHVQGGRDAGTFGEFGISACKMGVPETCWSAL